jgi:hypothetical protein
MTLRLFDTQTRSWSVWWAATSEPGRLLPPVVGRFVDGRGSFFGDDLHDGRPVGVLYARTDITQPSARWRQASPTDHGQTRARTG